MGRKAGREIQEFTDLPVGNYTAVIEDFKEAFSKQTNKLMYSVTFAIEQPQSVKGRKHFENFVIGSDDDPNAEQEETWNCMGGGQLLSMTKALGVPLPGEDMDMVAQHCIRKRLCFRVQENSYLDKKTNKVVTRNQVKKWAAEGLMEPMIDPIELVGSVPTQIATQPPAAPVAPVPVPTPITPVAPPQAPAVAPEVPFVPAVPPAFPPGQ